MCRIDEFWNIHETFSHFFSKQAKLRQAIRTETADFKFQISNFEIRQIAFLMTCRPHKTRGYFFFNESSTEVLLEITKIHLHKSVSGAGIIRNAGII